MGTSASEDLPHGLHPTAPPTIRDVARAAGVTVGTVSKALNGRGKLRQETRERVRAEASRLGFRPNELAKSLLRKRSFTVGLLSADSYGRFSIPLLRGIEDALGEEQISVFLCNARDDAKREREHLHSLLAKQVDGIIVTGRRIDPRPAPSVNDVRTPVVYAYAQDIERARLSIVPDEVEGGRLATKHLLAHGRRTFGHITGPMHFEAVRLRSMGMIEALQANGLTIPGERILTGPWHEAWGYEAASRLLDIASNVDAIFCGSDQLARGVMEALRDRGVRVPQDVALAGFDNWEVMATATRPPLTTIDPDLYELGRLAGRRLVAMIGGARETGVIRLPCRLVVRGSCGSHGDDSPNSVEGSPS